jgi:hypothetical protein
MSTSGEDTASERPPDIIYHYTTQSGLLGIIKSKQIRATHFRHLNDTEEFNYARKLLLKEAEAKENPAQPDEALKRSLQGLGNLAVNLFVASFSENPDSLPQWRAHAATEPGYALGFRPSVWNLPKDFRILKCLYDETEQREKARQILTGIAHDLQKIPEDVNPDMYANASTTFALIHHALALKHPSFEQELEWRIISKSLWDDPPYKTERVPGGFVDTPKPEYDPTPLCFRKGKSGIIPYRCIPLKGRNGVLPLAEIVVGPCPDPDRSCRSVRSLLVSRLGDWTRKGVPVRGSTIPYRNW